MPERSIASDQPEERDLTLAQQELSRRAEGSEGPAPAAVRLGSRSRALTSEELEIQMSRAKATLSPNDTGSSSPLQKSRPNTPPGRSSSTHLVDPATTPIEHEAVQRFIATEDVVKELDDGEARHGPLVGKGENPTLTGDTVSPNNDDAWTNARPTSKNTKTVMTKNQMVTSLKSRHERMAAMTCTLPFAILHMFVYALVLFNHYDMDAINEVQTSVASKILKDGSSSFTGGTFEDISTPDEMFTWLEDVMVPTFWPASPAPPMGGKAPTPTPLAEKGRRRRMAGALTKAPVGAGPRTKAPVGGATKAPVGPGPKLGPGTQAPTKVKGSGTNAPTAAAARSPTAGTGTKPTLSAGAGAASKDANKASSKAGAFMKKRDQSKKQVNSYLLFNKVVGGVLIRQRRVEAKECHVYYDDAGLELHTEVLYQDDCHPRDEEIEPCWESGSGRAGGCKNLSAIGLNSVKSAELLYLDLNETRTSLMTMLKNDVGSSWVDAYTHSIDVVVTMYNGELGIYSVIVLEVNFMRGGRMDTHSSVLSAQVPKWNRYKIAWDCVYGAFVLQILVTELYEMLGAMLVCDQGRPGLRVLRWGFLRYAFNFWNIIDWATVTFAAWQGSLFYELNNNLDTTFGLLYENVDAALTTDDILGFSQAMQHAAELSFLIRRVGALMLFLLVGRFFKELRRHPRLSFVTNTLSKSMDTLIPFAFVFVFVYGSFAVAGKLLFGADVEAFAGLSNSVLTLFNMLLGEFDYDSLAAVDTNNAVIFFWFFYILCYYLLLNMLLAIILDAYNEVKAESLNKSPIMRDFHIFGYMLTRLVQCQGPSSYSSMAKLLHDSDLESFTIDDLELLCGLGSEEASMLFEDTVEDVADLLHDEHEQEVTRGDLLELKLMLAQVLDKVAPELDSHPGRGRASTAVLEAQYHNRVEHSESARRLRRR